MNKDIYLHAICVSSNERLQIIETQRKLCKILESRALLSSKLRNERFSYGFNGKDYISLCDYEKRNIKKGSSGKYNAYYSYIRNSLSIVFPKEKVDVITPIILDEICSSTEGYKKMYELGKSKYERYSDFPDEVQVKDRISLSKMVALTYPVHFEIGKDIDSSADKIMFDLNIINDILIKYGYNVPIYDIDTNEELGSLSKVRMLLKNR